MTFVMLSVDTVAKAANAAMNAELDPQDLEGLNAITRLNLIAAMALVAQEERPPMTTMAISPEDFALLSSEWKAARDGNDVRSSPALPKPKLVTNKD